MLRTILAVTLATTTCAFAQKEDPFAEGVRKTEPLTPQEQQKKFKLPPGFEIQLVAAEPDLRKPMNMAFDATGRLWVSESREYPFPAKEGAEKRDSIRIFSDFGPDGRAKKVEVFADGLNIPIGLYPYRTEDGRWKCIAWSIPNIWLFEDTDNDGKADKREVLFGPLGWERDTHGNQASFRRGDDGWIYATHGFNNISTFKAKDGSTINLSSGNTYRFRIDGSRVEQHTWGQVNPYGLCWDDRGNLFSADCHSSPIYQLLRGGQYPSFGKPHDGIGFAPQTIVHSHGSTAICGPMLVRDTAWPAELQGHMFVGNVMTSRLNHDLIEWKGSSSKGKELPDFLTSDDPWFRPVDLLWGPDGALYVADFYNRIIGHYEVPLQHPGRDRERGRLWRVVYRGVKGDQKWLNPSLADSNLYVELGSTNPTRRSLALNEICDRIGKDAINSLEGVVASPLNAYQLTNALWALERLGAQKPGLLVAALNDPNPMTRTHALQICRGRNGLPLELVRQMLGDPDPIVRRNATEVLTTHPAPENFAPLLALLRRTDKADDHLIYSTRLALRDHLRNAGVARSIKVGDLPKEDLAVVLDIMPAVPGEHAALLRLDLFEKLDVAPGELAKQLPSIIKNAPAERLDGIVALAHKKLPDAVATLGTILEAFDSRGVPPSPALRDWTVKLVPQLLAGKSAAGWTNTGVVKSPWALENRKCADGETASVMSSIVGGEDLTGVLRSAAFTAPEKLRFYLCGHDGEPKEKAGKKNYIRLVDAADGKMLREAAPPRNDTAQRIEWDLAEFKGRKVRLEATDGDDGDAYAWIAFGRFKPELPELSLGEPAGKSPRAIAAGFAARFKLSENAPAFEGIFADRSNDVETRAAAARALVVFLNEVSVAGQAIPQKLEAIVAALNNVEEPAPLREKIATALGEVKSPGFCQIVVNALSTAPQVLQQSYAAALTQNGPGIVVLLQALENGKAPIALLRSRVLVRKLEAHPEDNAKSRVAALVAKLPAVDDTIEKLLNERRAGFAKAKTDTAKGAAIFQTMCAVCHQIGQKGNLVGPQLDGIGARGLDRILEDILDPNRNVDRAFRLSVVTLKDGGVASGLFRREEGAQLILADFTGKEITVPLANVAKREESDTSLMPPAFGLAMPLNDFNDLIAYLLAQKATK